MSWCTALEDDRGDLGDPGRINTVISQMLQPAFPVPPRP
jgi:hypothetical protein